MSVAFVPPLGEPQRPVPIHLQSLPARVCKFGLVCIACCLASGPVASWPTVVPLLVKYNVFGSTSLTTTSEESLANKELQDVCFNLVFNLASSAALISSAAAGLAFDNLGPQICSIIGSLAAAAGLALSGLAVQYQALNYLLYVGYPLASAGGWSVAYAAYGYIWAFGNHRQNLIAGIGTATTAISDSIIIAGVFLDRDWLPFPYFLASMGIVSALSSIVFLYYVPSNREYLAAAEYAVMEDMAAREREDSGSPRTSLLGQAEAQETSRGEKREQLLAAVELAHEQELPKRSCTEDLMDSYVAYRQYGGVNTHFFLYILLVYCFVIVATNNQYIFYQSLALDAKQLVNLYAVIYGFGGAIMYAISGRITDLLGLELYFALQILLVLGYGLAIFVPSFEIQIFAQLVQIFLLASYNSVIFRWTIIYVPARLLGTFTGLQFALIGLLQIAIVEAVQTAASLCYSDPLSSEFFLSQTSSLAALSILVGVPLLLRLLATPPPEVGKVQLEADSR